MSEDIYPKPTVEDACHLLKRILVESHYETKPKTPTLNDCKLFIWRAEGTHFDLEAALKNEVGSNSIRVLDVRALDYPPDHLGPGNRQRYDVLGLPEWEQIQPDREI